MGAHKWEFSARFRRNAFGWKSQPPIQRIKEAVTEIRSVAKKKPMLAAEGAVLFLEKLSPAIEQVDSSSGSIGSAVNRAIEVLVPIIAKAEVDEATRQKWLERLWEAIQDDDVPYLEWLINFWGEMCVTPEIASRWADDFKPTVELAWSSKTPGHGYFKGSTACLSALYCAGRHEELLGMLEKSHHKWWYERRWGVKALIEMGRTVDAIRYAEESRGLNEPASEIARFCEEILLASGMVDEAYARYALEANQGATNLATFRAIAKKYPNKPAETILRDLVARYGDPGKWFAAAKDAGLFDFAVELISRGSADPRTLIRASRDYAVARSDFAIAVGMEGLRLIAVGHGYDITSVDVLDAYSALVLAANASGIGENQMKAQIRQLLLLTKPQSDFVLRALIFQISS